MSERTHWSDPRAFLLFLVFVIGVLMLFFIADELAGIRKAIERIGPGVDTQEPK